MTIMRCVRTSLLSLLLCGVALAAPPGGPTPPTQPAQGPGGSDYKHAQVVMSQHGGDAGTSYHLFEPASPKPDKAPVIVFNHGFAAFHPAIYGQWIEHLVRRGNIVIYPRWQANILTQPKEYTPNAVAAVKDALAVLSKGDHVRPDTSKFAIVGHSAGGVVSANLAAVAQKEGLAKVGAVMCVQPGSSLVIPLENLKSIPAEALLLTVAGDQDFITFDFDCRRFLRDTPQIPDKNKNFVVLVTDTHGSPALRGNHFAPVCVGGKGIDTGGEVHRNLKALIKFLESQARAKAEKEGKSPGEEEPRDEALFADALDYYGTWKLFDGLTDAAFFGKHREYALGNTKEQRFMGKWSDGKAVKELAVKKP